MSRSTGACRSDASEFVQDDAGPFDDGARQARELGHLDAVGAVRGARHDLVQEHDVALELVTLTVTLHEPRQPPASAVNSWKWVANSARQRLASCRCSIAAQAIDRPSKVAVPRPISSRITSERGVAWLRIAAVSTISTMKVERPRARSSAAPTRENSRSTTPICARRAGTKLPICASTAMSAFWRR